MDKENQENNENKDENNITFETTKTIKKKTKFLDIKTNLNINKNPIIRKKSENLSTTININKTEFIPPRKKSAVKFALSIDDAKKKEIQKSSKKLNEYDKDNDNHTKSGEDSPNKSSKHFNSVISKKNSVKKRPIRRYESTGAKGNTFFNKFIRKKTMKKWKDNNTIEEKNEKENKIIKVNYNKLISKNIEKNQQNLNNPEEYFEGFFNDIIFKRQGNNNDLLNENNVQKNSSFGY